MDEPITELAYFHTLVADAEQLPLLEAAASLAQDEHPGLDLQQVLASVDRLAGRLAERCRNRSTEIDRLQVLLNFFYKESGFAGNINDYYTPDNSFIHQVLETRRGIPISLAVLLMELAGHVGLTSHGIGFPGHFLVAFSLHDGTVVIDPFTGASLSRDELAERLEPFREPLGLAADGELPVEMFLQPASSREILLRMLRNLREIYEQQGEPEKLKAVLERIEILERLR